MPFLVSDAQSTPTTTFYLIRSVSSHLGASTLILKKAMQFAQQGRKVLLFDTLLGLKNISIPNKNAKKIPDFLKGHIPLTDLITTYKNIDIITGVSSQNLNACPILQQNKIKQDLLQLSKSYDEVLIDIPYNVTSKVFDDMGSNFWVVSADKKILLNTLKTAEKFSPHLVLNETLTEKQLNEFFLFLKTLAPNCLIETHFV